MYWLIKIGSLERIFDIEPSRSISWRYLHILCIEQTAGIIHISKRNWEQAKQQLKLLHIIQEDAMWVQFPKMQQKQWKNWSSM